MKKFLYIIIGLFCLYIILCLIGPKHFRAERSIEINAPKEFVKSKLTDYKFFQEKWSPWTEKDPKMQVTYIGNPGEIGHKLAWESKSKDVGVGSMTYKYTNNDTIMHSLYFEGEGESPIYHIVTGDDKKCKVTWIMANDVPFFGRVFMLFIDIEKMIAPDFEKGLLNFKQSVENTSFNTENKE
jgi:hypothetical protein